MIVDVLLVVVLGLQVLGGARRGVAVTVLGALGVAIGVVAAVAFLPGLVAELLGEDVSRAWRVLATVGGVLFAAAIGQAVGAALGRSMRGAVRPGRGLRVLDALGGAVAALVITALLAWLVLAPLRTGPWPAVNREIASSRILAAVDEVLPPAADRITQDLATRLVPAGFPRVFGPADQEPIPEVAAADEGLARSGAVAAARSTVKVFGQGAGCSTGLSGTGIVIGPDLVLTNAHVVASLDEVIVTGPDGTGSERGHVVLFDPAIDVAAVRLHDAELNGATWGDNLAPRDQALVLGFPGGGAFDVEPVRVRTVIRAVGVDIYGEQEAARQVYSLRGHVEPGHSGAPVVDAAGHVRGMVFARSQDDGETAYALTAAELEPLREEATTLSAPVDTGPCPS